MDEDIEFKEMKAKIDSFKDELKAIVNKYNFGIQEIDNYDSLDGYSGSSYHFEVNDEIWHSQSIEEIINEIVIKK